MNEKKLNNHRYYLSHKDKYREKHKKWIKENPERYKIICQKSGKKYLQTPKGIYSVLKDNTIYKGKGWKLKISQRQFLKWYSRQIKKCFYCGLSEKLAKKITGKRLTIDRKDNSLPYKSDNIVLACEICNGVKGKYLTYLEMKEVGKIIKKRWKNL